MNTQPENKASREELFLAIANLFDEHGIEAVLEETSLYFAMVQDDEEENKYLKKEAEFLELEMDQLRDRFEHHCGVLASLFAAERDKPVQSMN